ncbi:hypothetical protein DPMN_074787 [Dreissena polymorpha]|uniref:Uncharacterized protein n=1 Tax=Dreissena polymorpha TaxID=45954 RepID=A0A9D4BEC4_DREPO|nr:hypothetical protein DPMN_074787 [Dreissena polymorpha]
MKAFEADAQARAARREARNKVAEEWKEKGNAEFRLGNFEKALEFYTKVRLEKQQSLNLGKQGLMHVNKSSQSEQASQDRHFQPYTGFSVRRYFFKMRKTI